jgi:hypothetical protein
MAARRYSIPAKARKVVEVLRRDVERPRRLPKLEGGRNQQSLRWCNGDEKCPMGLHPDALLSLPYASYHFPPIPDDMDAVPGFASWWDSLTNPRAAVDTIWPPKKKTAKTAPRRAKKK